MTKEKIVNSKTWLVNKLITESLSVYWICQILSKFHSELWKNWRFHHLNAQTGIITDAKLILKVMTIKFNQVKKKHHEFLTIIVCLIFVWLRKKFIQTSIHQHLILSEISNKKLILWAIT